MNGEGIDIYAMSVGNHSKNDVKLTYNNVILTSDITNAHEEFLYNLKRLGVSGDVEKTRVTQRDKRIRGKKNFHEEMRKDKPAWFDNKTGGYYIMQQGHEYNKETRLEIDAAKYLAKMGHKVILQPEGDGSGGISFRLSNKRKNTYSEGTIDKIYYEQYSTKEQLSKHAYTGIDHAHKKGVSTALIYDIGEGGLSDSAIKDAIKDYNSQYLQHYKYVKYVLILRKNKNRVTLTKWNMNGKKIR